MPRVFAYWPVLPGLLSLALMFYVIDQGQWFYEFRGCRPEDYPEIAFLLFGAPLALVSILLGLVVVNGRLSVKRRCHWIIGSLVCSALCVILVPTVAFEFGGNQSDRCVGPASLVA